MNTALFTKLLNMSLYTLEDNDSSFNSAGLRKSQRHYCTRSNTKVITLTIFCLFVFALFALKVYLCELRYNSVPRLESTKSLATDGSMEN
jgi:hypothetical protein